MTALAFPLLDRPGVRIPEDDGLCHIDDGTERSNLCLAPGHPGRVTCQTAGVSGPVCSDCGKPTCVRCAVLALLVMRMRRPA